MEKKKRKPKPQKLEQLKASFERQLPEVLTKINQLLKQEGVQGLNGVEVIGLHFSVVDDKPANDSPHDSHTLEAAGTSAAVPLPPATPPPRGCEYRWSERRQKWYVYCGME